MTMIPYTYVHMQVHIYVCVCARACSLATIDSQSKQYKGCQPTCGCTDLICNKTTEALSKLKYSLGMEGIRNTENRIRKYYETRAQRQSGQGHSKPHALQILIDKC
jgi:hypothetical protein